MPIVTLLAAAVSPIAQIPPAPPAPPVMAVTKAAQRQTLFDFVPGNVSCEGGTPRPVTLVKPIPSAGLIPVGLLAGPYDFTFSIAADGRVYRIAEAPGTTRAAYIETPDLQPALAASRFAPGAPQARCRIRYDVATEPLATAPRDLIHRYLFAPHQAVSFEREISRLSTDTAGDCFIGKFPIPLLQGNPDLNASPLTPGMVSMTVVAHDIDRSGKPRNIRTETSVGDVYLDAAMRAATARSRYRKGTARTGCYRPFMRRNPPPVPAPESPELSGFAWPGGGCPPEDASWAYLPRLTYPEAFRRRAIEGWAIVRYDVAPWGQVANVRVVASEPAAAFGDQARGIVSSGRRTPSERGASACVERVRFKMPVESDDETTTPPTVPD